MTTSRGADREPPPDLPTAAELAAADAFHEAVGAVDFRLAQERVAFLEQRVEQLEGELADATAAPSGVPSTAPDAGLQERLTEAMHLLGQMDAALHCFGTTLPNELGVNFTVAASWVKSVREWVARAERGQGT